MKKKLGDLTLKEAQRICKKRPFGFCRTCPLKDLCQCSFDYDNQELDQEVEVEE